MPWYRRALLLATIVLACQPVAAGARGASSQGRAFWCGGVRIPFERYLPRSAGRHPAIVLLHGSGGPAGNSAWIKARTRALIERGYVVFIPHYFARTGTSRASLVTIAMDLELWVDTAHAALDAVTADPAVDAGRVGLLGLSLGSFVALGEASGDGRVKAVAELLGGLAPAHVGAASQLPPVLIVHGERDTVVPVRWAYALRDLLARHRRPYELHIYPGMGHGLHGAARADCDRRIDAFFDRILKPPHQAR